MAEKPVRVNVTLKTDLLERIDSYAKEKYEDRSTAMRQLIHAGLQERRKKDVAYAYGNARIKYSGLQAGVLLSKSAHGDVFMDPQKTRFVPIL